MKHPLAIITILLLLPMAFAAENETVILTLQLNSTNNCNITISISTAKELYSPGEQIQFYNNLSEKNHNYKIKYYIINEQNEIIKNPVITQNLNLKTFTPNQKRNNYEITIKNELLEIGCNNLNQITTSEKTLLIEGNPNITEDEPKSSAKQTAKETAKTQAKASQTKAANKTAKTETPQKNYTIAPLAQSESLLNNKGEDADEIFVSGEEKSKSYVPYMLIAALVLLTVYLMKNGFQNKRNNRSSRLPREAC